MAKASILTEMDVRRLRELARKRTLNVRFEALFYGVAAETIRRAVRGETWSKLHMNPQQTKEENEAEVAASFAKLQRLLAGEKEHREAGNKMVEEIVQSTPRSPLDE